MMTGPLTPDEIQAWTGYKLPKLQHDWLARHGIPARRRRDGTVAVTWEQINAAPASAAPARARPNLEAARG